jgi:diacylglycerol kinase (ATP)
MNASHEPVPAKPSGMRRVLLAFRHSYSGYKNALATEAALRQEVLSFVLLTPVAVLLPLTAVEKLLLVCSMLLVIVVELLNTAIEATVDRISLERHPLAGQAKDLGSAAVLTSVTLSVICWVVIAGPVALHYLNR